MKITTRLIALTCVAASTLGFPGIMSSAADAQEATRETSRLLVAQAAPSDAEKQAFESAKELGTVEAWDAFLSTYPSGFYADLARAYVKKLAEPSGTPAKPVTTPAAPLMRPSIGMLSMAPPAKSVADMPTAAKRPCSERFDLRTQTSDTPARITFINYGKDPIEVYWLDEKGQQQLFGEIKQNRQAAVETAYSHPWLVTDLAAKCIAIALPSPGPQVFVIGTETSTAAPSTKTEKKTSSGSSCSSGQIRVDGRCIAKKDAASFCGPGYMVRNGKCVSKYEDQPAAPSQPRCPKGQVWSPQELCHYDD